MSRNVLLLQAAARCKMSMEQCEAALEGTAHLADDNVVVDDFAPTDHSNAKLQGLANVYDGIKCAMMDWGVEVNNCERCAHKPLDHAPWN